MAKKTNTIVHGKKRYRTRLMIGLNENGDKVFKSFYGDSKTSAEKAKEKYLEYLEYRSELTFDELMTEWLEVVHRPSIALSSYSRYESIYRNHIKKSNFAKKLIQDVKPLNIQKHLNKIDSRYTATRVYNLLSTFFKYCLSSDYIRINPLNNVNKPKIEEIDNAKKYLDKDDLSKIMYELSSNKDYFVFQFTLYSGIRQGELIALTLGDIDFTANTININKNMRRYSIKDEHGVSKAVFEVAPPKTKSSIRTIYLNEDLISNLKKHINNERQKYFKIGRRYNNEDLLFSNKLLNPLRGDRLNEKFKKLQIELGISPVTFHKLRHTFCTVLAEQNVPIKVASTLLGHSRIETTANIYTHVSDNAKEDAIKSLNFNIKSAL